MSLTAKKIPTIIECWTKAMYLDPRIQHDDRFGPFASLLAIVRLNVGGPWRTMMSMEAHTDRDLADGYTPNLPSTPVRLTWFQSDREDVSQVLG